MNYQSLDMCVRWASSGNEVTANDVARILKRHQIKATIHGMLSLLPPELKAEYAGALHLRVSGEWAIHPSTAFDTLNAEDYVMLEELEKLLLAHPECRPTLPKALALTSGPAATGSEGVSGATTAPASLEASEG